MKTSFCVLYSYSNIKELLQKELSFSASFLKKKLPKKYLEKSVRERDQLEFDLDLLNNNLINPSFNGEVVELILEDENVLVLNKPYGMHGHPLEYAETDTVLNFLRCKYSFSFLGKFSTNQERGLLYRLDELTSGVLIYIKDEATHTMLRENFNKVVKTKTYLALVSGKLDIDREVVDFLEGSGTKGSKIKLSDCGVKCSGHYKTIAIFEDNSLIEINLETGFRHQIRAQLSFLGHPILGDVLYGAAKSDRMYLHALRYEFQVQGKLYSVSADYEKLFCDFLNTDSLIKML